MNVWNIEPPKVKKCVNCHEDFKRSSAGFSVAIVEYFCSTKCAKEFSHECAEQGMRRLGYSLVRFNKGDRRAG
tara:strand:+ start:1169 stop:1387 length:219 start_codon:yes stop_codon:yes gene_type:complete